SNSARCEGLIAKGKSPHRAGCGKKRPAILPSAPRAPQPELPPAFKVSPHPVRVAQLTVASNLIVPVLRLLAVALVFCGLSHGEMDDPPADGAAPASAHAHNVNATPTQFVLAVRDETEAAVPFARVTFVVPGTNISLQRQTDFRGVLRLPLVAG